MKRILSRLIPGAVLSALLSLVVVGTGATPALAASWSGWGSLPGLSAAGPPASVGLLNGSLQVFARKGSLIWVKTWSPSTGWSIWSSIGSPCSSSESLGDPAASVRASGAVDLLVACGDPNDYRTIYHRWFQAAVGWSSWGSIGQPSVGAAYTPAISGRASGEIDVVVPGNNGAMYHKWWSSSTGWNGWGSIGSPSGGTYNRPAVSGRGTGEIDVLALNSSGTVYHKWWSASTGWNPWGSLGTVSGGFAYGVAATSRPGTLDVFARNSAGTAVYHRSWSSSTGWSGWGSLGQPEFSSVNYAPTASVRTSGELDVLVTDSSGVVYHKWYG
jgi:hypothetical protein